MLGKVAMIQLDDSKAQQAQQGLNDRVNQLSGIQFLDGIRIEQVSLKAGDNTINHKLGRAYTGYLITRQRAQSSIYDSSNTNFDKYLVLTCTSDVVIDLWVF